MSIQWSTDTYEALQRNLTGSQISDLENEVDVHVAERLEDEARECETADSIIEDAHSEIVRAHTMLSDIAANCCTPDVLSRRRIQAEIRAIVTALGDVRDKLILD